MEVQSGHLVELQQESRSTRINSSVCIFLFDVLLSAVLHIRFFHYVAELVYFFFAVIEVSCHRCSTPNIFGEKKSLKMHAQAKAYRCVESEVMTHAHSIRLILHARANMVELTLSCVCVNCAYDSCVNEGCVLERKSIDALSPSTLARNVTGVYTHILTFCALSPFWTDRIHTFSLTN